LTEKQRKAKSKLDVQSKARKKGNKSKVYGNKENKGESTGNVKAKADKSDPHFYPLLPPISKRSKLMKGSSAHRGFP